MTVYVDSGKHPYGRMQMCHMLADTLNELHAMADRIGVKRKWYQNKSIPHYDICLSKRRLAIRAGANEIDRKQTVGLIRQWRARIQADTLSRVPSALYLQVRDWLIANDPDGAPMYRWADQAISRPTTVDQLAGEIIWIILCAGRKAQAARTIEKKVWHAIKTGKPVVSVFGYQKKAQAIERAWHEREQDFMDLMAIPEEDVNATLAWCESLPFVGSTTKYQLGKNLGLQVCKPDIWLSRLAGIPDSARCASEAKFETCQALCRHIADLTGDKVPVIDSLLWLGCNKGVLSVTPEAGDIQFLPTSRSLGVITPEALQREESGRPANGERYQGQARSRKETSRAGTRSVN